MSDTIKTIKGFDGDLKCRNFQYEVGKTYTLPDGEMPELCSRGFHAIDEDACPLSVFDYYPPADENGRQQRYCEVEVSGDAKHDGGKVVGSQLTVGAEIGIPGIVKAHIEWVKRHLFDDDKHKSSNTGYQSSASNTGNQSSAEVSGKDSVAIVTGRDCMAKGALGCWLVLTERDKDWKILGMKAVKVDGRKIKPDVWYKLIKGKVKQVKED